MDKILEILESLNGDQLKNLGIVNLSITPSNTNPRLTIHCTYTIDGNDLILSTLSTIKDENASYESLANKLSTSATVLPPSN